MKISIMLLILFMAAPALPATVQTSIRWVVDKRLFRTVHINAFNAAKSGFSSGPRRQPGLSFHEADLQAINTNYLLISGDESDEDLNSFMSALVSSGIAQVFDKQNLITHGNGRLEAQHIQISMPSDYRLNWADLEVSTP